jgi:hypothetical protein
MRGLSSCDQAEGDLFLIPRLIFTPESLLGSHRLLLSDFPMVLVLTMIFLRCAGGFRKTSGRLSICFLCTWSCQFGQIWLQKDYHVVISQRDYIWLREIACYLCSLNAMNLEDGKGHKIYSQFDNVREIRNWNHLIENELPTLYMESIICLSYLLNFQEGTGRACRDSRQERWWKCPVKYL